MSYSQLEKNRRDLEDLENLKAKLYGDPLLSVFLTECFRSDSKQVSEDDFLVRFDIARNSFQDSLTRADGDSQWRLRRRERL